MPIKIGDIDIDMPNRLAVLKHIRHVPACRINQDTILEHNTGVYVQDIPVDPVLGIASIEYQTSEDLGYFKIDFLNLALYEGIKNKAHLSKLANQEPNWDLLQYKHFVQKLNQLANHFEVVNELRPKSLEQLAMTLAIIRPGKKHLIGKPWNEIEKEIWLPNNQGYVYKKSHAVSYALSLVVQMNMLVEQGYDFE